MPWFPRGWADRDLGMATSAVMALLGRRGTLASARWPVGLAINEIFRADLATLGRYLR